MGVNWSLPGPTRSHLYESGAIFNVQTGCNVRLGVAGLWGKKTQYQVKLSIKIVEVNKKMGMTWLLRDSLKATCMKVVLFLMFKQAAMSEWE